MTLFAGLKEKVLGSLQRKRRGREMLTIQCPECGEKSHLTFESQYIDLEKPRMEYVGRIVCSSTKKHKDSYEWPLTVAAGSRGEIVRSTAPTLVAGARPLSSTTPPGIQDDIQEAERAYLSQCYKASVVMCRRALQLALEGKGANGRTLGPVLGDALQRTLVKFQPGTIAILQGVKDVGDGAAHRRIVIAPEIAVNIINVTIMALNEIFP